MPSDITLLPGQSWPADLFTHPDCMHLDRHKNYGEDFIDLFWGCVLGALEQNNLPLARSIVATSNATAAEKARVRAEVVRLVGESIAAQVFEGKTPWYKNWKVLVPVGAGALALTALTVWVVRRKRARAR